MLSVGVVGKKVQSRKAGLHYFVMANSSVYLSSLVLGRQTVGRISLHPTYTYLN